MTELQHPADKIAISLSVLCVIHCLATPMLIVFLPSVASVWMESELLHMWMVVAVLPTSVLALTLGCKKHRNLKVVVGGIVGLACLLVAVASEVLGFGEVFEKSLTLLGATLISIAHYFNYRLCQQHAQSCECH